MGDIDEAADTAERIHALAERLAFRLLGGDTLWVDRFAYYHLYARHGEYPPWSER